jgi:hypothetical protein
MHTKNTETSAIQKEEILESSLDNFINELQQSFDALEIASAHTKATESALQSMHFSYTFSHLINIEESSLKDPEERHKVFPFNVYGFTLRRNYFMMWDKDDQISKKYRLYFVIKENERIFYWPSADNPKFNETYDLPSRIVYKRPFLDTTFENRLKYADKLSEFIDKFKDIIRNNRSKITKS